MSDIEAIHTWQRSSNVPFGIRMGAGLIANARPVFVFGFNPDVQTVEETVWDHGGVYAYPSSAVTMTVSSSSANTNAVVSVVGLGADYVEQTELVTTNGQTPVSTTKQYLRINAVSALTGTVADSIYIGAGTVTGGIPANVYARVINGNNRTEMGVYTVPAGHTLYVTRGSISHGSDSSAYITGRLMYRLQGLLFSTAAKITLNNKFIDFVFDNAIALPEKSDLETRAICSKQQVNAVSTSFQGVLLKDGLLT
jgi:hypothetical protein